MTAKRTTAKTRTDLYDSLTLAIERADSLTALIERRLSALTITELADAEADTELYALSLVAAKVSDEHQQILEHARALFTAQAKVTP